MTGRIVTYLCVCLWILSAASCSGSSGPDPEPEPGPEKPTLETTEQAVVLCEQSQRKIIIIDIPTKRTLWEWSASSSSIPPQHWAYFRNLDEAKPVYSRQYVLITASSGGVAMIRLSDKKVMFYACPRGNPHSAEILPDGNIVVSCSTEDSEFGDALRIYKMDTVKCYAESDAGRFPLEFGHNAVWDNERNLLWATAKDVMRCYSYDNTDPAKPFLTLEESYKIPGTNVHDLFPAFGEDRLWLTSSSAIFSFYPESKSFGMEKTAKDIKSVSSGPEDFPTIIISPTESYWSYRVTTIDGKTVYEKEGSQIYKARWLLDNAFSYPANNDKFKQP